MMIKRLNYTLNYKLFPTQKILKLELTKQLNKSGCSAFNMKHTALKLQLQSGQDKVDQAMCGF